MKSIVISYKPSNRERFLALLQQTSYKKLGSIFILTIMIIVLLYQLAINLVYRSIFYLVILVILQLGIWFSFAVFAAIIVKYADVFQYDVAHNLVISDRYFISNRAGEFFPWNSGWSEVSHINYDPNRSTVYVNLDSGGWHAFNTEKWVYQDQKINLVKLFNMMHQQWNDKYKEDGEHSKEIRKFLDDIIISNPHIEKHILYEYFRYSCNKLGETLSIMLEGQGIRNLPGSICNLTTLTSLDLIGNELRKIPECISRLVKLEALMLWENPIIEISEALLELNSLQEI